MSFGLGKIKIGIFWKKGLKTQKFWLSWWAFAWASAKRALSERAQLILDIVRLSELQANKPSRFWTQVAWASFKWASPEATGSRSLKRATLRLSEQYLVQQLLIFRFVHLGTNPNFLECFFWLVWSLFIYLILLEHHLKSNWTWIYEMNLTFGKCLRTPIFLKFVFLKWMM